MISEIDRNKLSLISGNDARETVAQLVTTKDRIAGSRAEQKSAEQVREKLAPFVDSIVIEHVPITAYDYSQASLYVAEPIGLSVPCIASRLSGSGEGTAPLVDGGFGSRRELDALGDRIRGSVLLLTSRSLFASLEDRMCMCVEARTRGAKCIIYHIEGKDDDVIGRTCLQCGLPHADYEQSLGGNVAEPAVRTFRSERPVFFRHRPFRRDDSERDRNDRRIRISE